MEEKLELKIIEYLKGVLNNEYYYFTTIHSCIIHAYLNAEQLAKEDPEIHICFYEMYNDNNRIFLETKGFSHEWYLSKENALTIRYLIAEIKKLKFSQVFG